MQSTYNGYPRISHSSSSCTRSTDSLAASKSSTFTNGSAVVESSSQPGFMNKPSPEPASPVSPTTHHRDVIPPHDLSKRQRTLVLCFDGTGDQFDSDNSNIVEFFSMLKKNDSDKQMCYYQAGIGTYTSPQIATPVMTKVSKTLDEMIAWNLGAHVMDGYEFLMQNYKEDDKICIFGFSRGAYTARALAGMICKVGLLPACNHQQVPFAYKMYTQADTFGFEQSSAFKETFSVNVEIEFLGVWDTVNSVGLIPRRLPFTNMNNIVHTFRHAIALDEHRTKFKVNHWKPPKNDPSTTPREQSSSGGNVNTNVEEVWFAGCHCDVGGGSVKNNTPHSLARIPLRWMIRECFRAKTGIMFYSHKLKKVGLNPSTLYPVVLDRPDPLPATNYIIQDISSKKAALSAQTESPESSNEEQDLSKLEQDFLEKERAKKEQHSLEVKQDLSEEEHDLLDAMSPIYDQLSIAPGWWVLEVLPMKQRLPKRTDDSVGRREETWTALINRKVGTWNMGHGRVIPRQKKDFVKLHRTVEMRMAAEYENGEKYIPKASFDRAIKYEKLKWVY